MEETKEEWEGINGLPIVIDNFLAMICLRFLSACSLLLRGCVLGSTAFFCASVFVIVCVCACLIVSGVLLVPYCLHFDRTCHDSFVIITNTQRTLFFFFVFGAFFFIVFAFCTNSRRLDIEVQ